MAANGATENVFICSYCESTIKVTPEHVGRRATCPKCQRPIYIYPNQSQSIAAALTSIWHYRRTILLAMTQSVGPVSDEYLLLLLAQGTITLDTDVCSELHTRGEWVPLRRVNLQFLKERVAQRAAENARLERIATRRRQAEQDARTALLTQIKAVVATGRISGTQRDQFVQLGRAAGIPDQEVMRVVQAECDAFVASVVEAFIEDGVLEPNEKQKLSEIALGMGVHFSLSKEQEEKLAICELAWQLSTGKFRPNSVAATDTNLGKGEEPLARTKAEWCEVVNQKKPVGIEIADGCYLKSIAKGDCILTNKRLMIVGKLAAKKAALSSVERCVRYLDGVLCVRSTGKSVFLKLVPITPSAQRFALILQHVITNGPVLGTMPHDVFAPVVVERPHETPLPPPRPNPIREFSAEPRFTFRVVGDHVEGRAYWIARLAVGDPVFLIREPSNPFDPNAVAVIDLGRNRLGYLKREVAEWFAPILDSGRAFRSTALRHLPDGGLIVAVFED